MLTTAKATTRNQPSQTCIAEPVPHTVQDIRDLVDAMDEDATGVAVRFLELQRERDALVAQLDGAAHS